MIITEQLALAPAPQGRGLASEALAGVIARLFGEHGMHREWR
jgi:RimJ/RimL family protein N-acetyltransferase